MDPTSPLDSAQRGLALRAPGLVVSVSGCIARSVDVVRRHFADVQHHIRCRVHPDVEFTLLEESDSQCRFRKSIRIFGVPIVDEVLLRREPDGSIREDSVAGSNVGMRLVSSFQAKGPQATATTLTLQMPLNGLMRIAAPVVRRVLTRRLAKAFDEDRRDLESGRYS